MLFNPDMDARLADLHAAVTSGGSITARGFGAFKHEQGALPPRVVVDIDGTDRRLTFPADMAHSLADQLTVNGQGEAANLIRKAVPVS